MVESARRFGELDHELPRDRALDGLDGGVRPPQLVGLMTICLGDLLCQLARSTTIKPWMDLWDTNLVTQLLHPR